MTMSDLPVALVDEIAASSRRLTNRLASIGETQIDFTETKAEAISSELEPYYEDQLQWLALWTAEGGHHPMYAVAGMRFAAEVLDILVSPSSMVNVNNAWLQRDILRVVIDELEVMATIIDRTIESEEQPA
jgi:hypothetical protein